MPVSTRRGSMTSTPYGVAPAASTALDLQVRQGLGDVLDRDVETLRGVVEVLLAVHPVRHHPQMVVGMLEHGAVVDEQAVLVEERAVADLAELHAEDVVRVDSLRRLEGIGAPEVPL